MAKKTELTAVEATRKLGVGLDYVYSLIWTGKLKGRKAGDRWLIPTSAVKARLAARGARRSAHPIRVPVPAAVSEAATTQA